MCYLWLEPMSCRLLQVRAWKVIQPMYQGNPEDGVPGEPPHILGHIHFPAVCCFVYVGTCMGMEQKLGAAGSGEGAPVSVGLSPVEV